ncbi:MAG TPA: YIP1 family protein [Vicinamibacterales bacterium]|nr:YIP1 family protein [Vicinamibacterales bacterium]
MATATTPTGQSAAPMNVFSRFIGIITAPRATFGSVVAHPKWLGMYLLTATIIAFGAALPMTTEAGKQAALDQQVSSMESLGFQVSDEMYEQLRQRMTFAAYQTAGSVLIFSIIVSVILAGILWAVFNAAMGGDATYKQILTVLIHAGAITALGQLFTGPLNYFRGAVTSATSLGALLPMLDDQSFVGKLAGMLDIFIVWWLIVLAIGLAVLYRRKTQPIAMTLFGIYAVIIVAIAAFMSR